MGSIPTRSRQPFRTPGGRLVATGRAKRSNSVYTGNAPLKRLVFDPGGRWLGVVELPTRLVPTEIGDGYVLGVWIDAFGVQTVRRYPLIKP